MDQNWVLMFNEKQILRVNENRVLRRKFGPMLQQVKTDYKTS
jgi:hypothetical protein